MDSNNGFTISSEQIKTNIEYLFKKYPIPERTRLLIGRILDFNRSASNAEIAKDLNFSKLTVKTYKGEVFKILGIKNSHELIRMILTLKKEEECKS